MKRVLKLTVIACLSACLLSNASLAEVTPDAASSDPRIRIVDYDRWSVIKITTFYGVSTHIEFSPYEEVLDISAGDPDAWEIKDRKNHLFIKPQQKKADTNLTIVTNRRVYNFALIVQPRKISDSTAWRDPNLTFSLAFKYPSEDKAREEIVARRANVEAQNQIIQDRLKKASTHHGNTDYWVKGSQEISPSEAWDDGRFVYLAFNNNKDMPAIYEVDAAGNESLINTNVINTNTIVVQRMVKELILRKGIYVASVVNKSFDPDGGINNISGTVSPEVKRTVKGR